MDKSTLQGLQIGKVRLENNLVLAPMAGVTDLPFRTLCKEQGAGLICMEMVSAKALQYNNKNTYQLLEIEEKERPVSLQLFGSDPDCISEMAKRIEDRPFDILDINMGCPVPKVVNNGDGSALMKNPKLAGQIMRKTVKAIQKPVTVKIRKGFDDARVNAVEMAKIAEDAGVAAIAVHGRTREQYYSGKADWDIIAQVKDAVSIPVIGNGDLLDAKDVIAMKEQTGCDGFMIGRGAQGNVVATMLRHAKMQIALKGDELYGIREFRKHAAWYTSGYHNSARLRGMINEVNTYQDLEDLMERVLR